MRRIHTITAVAALGVAAAAAWWLQRPAARTPTEAAATGRAAGAGPAGSGAAVTVEVARAASMALEDDATTVGSLRSNQGVVLRPEVSGRIARLGFRDGQAVKKGQLLVQLDDALQRAQLAQAQAQAAIAETTVQRNRDLVAQNFVSRSALDQSEAALEVARAQVQVADAQLARMTLLAPFDGVTGIRSVSVGDYVKDGAEIVAIEDLSRVKVDFRLPERHVDRLALGQVVQIDVDALPGRRFTGRVEATDVQVDANGRAMLVRAAVDNAAGVLKPGMFARARIVFARRAQAIVVPEEALVPMGGRQYIVRVDSGPDGARSHRVEARIGLRVAGRVEIVAGLADGDTVVVAGQTRLMGRDGVPLRVVEVGRAPGGAGSSPGVGNPAAAPASGSAPRG